MKGEKCEQKKIVKIAFVASTFGTECFQVRGSKWKTRINIKESTESKQIKNKKVHSHHDL